MDRIEVLNKMLNLTRSLTDQKKEVKDDVLFSILIIERLQQSLETIKTLLANTGIRKHGHAIGLIGRNVLSDYLMFIYVFGNSVIHDPQYVVQWLFNDDIKRVENHINWHSDNGLLPEADLFRNGKVEFESDVSDKHWKQALLKTEKDIPEKDRIKSLSTGAIAKHLILSDSRFARFARIAYDIWIHWSKYEHIGWYSYKLTRIDIKDNSERIDFLITCSLEVFYMSSSIAKKEDVIEGIIALNKQWKEHPTSLHSHL